MASWTKKCLLFATLISIVLNVALVANDLMNFDRFVKINMTVFIVTTIIIGLRYLLYVAIRENPE